MSATVCKDCGRLRTLRRGTECYCKRTPSILTKAERAQLDRAKEALR